jgi:small subunit ribosomal protein S6
MAVNETVTSGKATKTNQYEAMFLFGSAFAGEVEKAVGISRGIIERHGGQVLVAKKWDERKLAYEIGGQKRGLYVITYFTAPGTAVGGIERDVNLSEDVLRVMVTDAAHLNADEMAAVEPQPIQPREERAPWDRPERDDRRGGGGYRGGDRGDRGGDRGPRPERAGERSDRGGDEKPAPPGGGE